MDEEGLRTAFGLLVVVLQPFLEGLDRKMAQVEIAPRGGLLGGAAPGASARGRRGTTFSFEAISGSASTMWIPLGNCLPPRSALSASELSSVIVFFVIKILTPPLRSRWQKGRWGGKDTTNYWIGRFLLLFSFASGRWPFFFLACLTISLVSHFGPNHEGDRSLAGNGRSPHFVKPLHKSRQEGEKTLRKSSV